MRQRWMTRREALRKADRQLDEIIERKLDEYYAEPTWDPVVHDELRYRWLQWKQRVLVEIDKELDPFVFRPGQTTLH